MPRADARELKDMPTSTADGIIGLVTITNKGTGTVESAAISVEFGRYYLLSNMDVLDGDRAGNTMGYRYSWLIGCILPVEKMIGQSVTYTHYISSAEPVNTSMDVDNIQMAIDAVRKGTAHRMKQRCRTTTGGWEKWDGMIDSNYKYKMED